MSETLSRVATKRIGTSQGVAQAPIPLTSVKTPVHRYRAAGEASAPVVLLLHGFPTSSFMFRKLIPLLGGDFRAIAPDLPGFGFTEPPLLAVWDKNDPFFIPARAEAFRRDNSDAEVCFHGAGHFVSDRCRDA